MDKKDGASASGHGFMKRDPEKVKQRKLKRGKRREDRRKHGFNKKRRAENKAEAATKRKAIAQAAIVGGDHQAGGTDAVQSSSIQGGQFQFDGTAMGASMKYRGKKYDNVPNMSVPAHKLQKIQDGSSMSYGKKHGSSMYGKKHGASMNASQDKSASMDDYSHEKKLKADGRYEAAHGKMANAENDFDHAHALKKDAHHDARSRVAILKHMKKF